jgi:hypothetical protein
MSEKSPPPQDASVKLPIFSPNEIKHFRFTPEQYILLEMEYNRYTIYKDLVKSIENLFKIHTTEKECITRKIYENKNIIERFVLECINHGLSPNTIKLYPESGEQKETLISIKSITIESVDIELVRKYLFFNKDLSNEVVMKDTPYFKKMISEYIEKKFRYTPDKAQQLLKILSAANYKFMRGVQELYSNQKKPGYFSSINCNLLVSDSENYIITYRGYSKVINFKRYARLILNYDRPFPFDIIRMLLRYALFDMSNQQWSIGITLYDEISAQLDIGFEMFASPLNFNMNMFCSLFLDTDKTFGSVGSFYNITVDKLLNLGLRGVFYNPPYLPLLMSATTRMCIQLLDKMRELAIDFTVVSFLPNWADATYIQDFLASRYTVFHQMIPKGQYVLHEKDRGKLLKGTFDLLFIVMNSRQVDWDDSRRCGILEVCGNIIKSMKRELLEKNIDK